MRFCVEIEANCTAILKENGYKISGRNMNMGDYKKIEQSHYLSKYEIIVPNWDGEKGLRTPFLKWATGDRHRDGLDWYQAYNCTKHDRHGNFHKATFNALIDAACGLCALISSQFFTYSFTSSDYIITVSGDNIDGFESAIGDFFRVKFPLDIPPNEAYEFCASDIDIEQDIFQDFQYK